ncbi:MobA/MobL family protein [Dokdonella immobilis]|uniref:MobA/MobL family protein n=2 Tax=Dokdonella immobilis TaxID=578942 RepID=A0A1I4XYV8_9GAMM|nr:MobA/MobL family protein [Dokdonella immobilis]
MADDRTGLVHDYRKKSGVVSAKMFAPRDAPPWATEVTALWNAAENAEARINSRVARELEVALPAELNAAQREALAHELAKMLVDRYSVAVMAAIHEPGPEGDGRNYHVHLLMTTRVVGANGMGVKARVLDDKVSGPMEVAKLREWVAVATNRHLAGAGFEDRVDHRTLGEQAGGAAVHGDLDGVAVLSREPTKHLGRAATALARRGAASDRASGAVLLASQNALLVAEGRLRALELSQQTPMARPSRPTRGNAPSRRPRISLKQSLRPSDASLIGDTALMVRATGADAMLLNNQATVLQTGLRAVRDDARKQVAALERSLRTSKALADSVLRAAQVAADQARGLPMPRAENRINLRVGRQPIERCPVAKTSSESGIVCPPRAGTARTRRQWAELRRAERKAQYTRAPRRDESTPPVMSSFGFSATKRRRPALDAPGPNPRWRPPSP